MALLPVYEWAGLDDDLSRGQQWGLNVLGILGVGLAGHALGVIDLSALSGDILRVLPAVQGAIVGVLAGLAVTAVLFAVWTRDLMDTRAVVLAAVGGFFLIDLFYLHPSALHFDNAPAMGYWLAKWIWVGVPMFFAVRWLVRNTEFDRRVAYTVAGLAGIVSLQLYYTVIPIPMVGGESVQVGLVGNLVVGVPVHGAALLLALAVVVVGIQGRRRFGGEA